MNRLGEFLLWRQMLRFTWEICRDSFGMEWPRFERWLHHGTSIEADFEHRLGELAAELTRRVCRQYGVDPADVPVYAGIAHRYMDGPPLLHNLAWKNIE